MWEIALLVPLGLLLDSTSTQPGNQLKHPTVSLHPGPVLLSPNYTYYVTDLTRGRLTLQLSSYL